MVNRPNLSFNVPQVASYAAAVGGPTAPFLASLPLLLMGSIIVVCTWSENRAVIGGGGGGGLRDGLYALMREPTLLALAFLQVARATCGGRVGHPMPLFK